MQGQSTLTGSVRFAIYRFFQQRMGDECLMDSLRWLIFQEFDNPKSEWRLSSCPLCDSRQIPLRRDEMTNRYTFVCEDCQGEIYLTDVLRLHERIDDELGAGEILAYTITLIEQFILVHLIRLILNLKPGLLEEILFIKDGPLAFFGPTLNMQRPMRALIQYLFKNHDLYLAGLEKSGGFVEHADEIADEMEMGTVLIIDNDYICHYVLPGVGDLSRPYGSSTYYSHKLIFKARDGSMYVVSLPVPQLKTSPQATDFRNLQVILTNIEKLKCDMYDSALVPVALVNKMVSLSHHPSSRILQRFATNSMLA